MVQVVVKEHSSFHEETIPSVRRKDKIIVEDVQFSYGDTKILSKIHLTVSEGEFLVFMGPSGCGKSTLLRLIAGLERFHHGDIRINNQSVHAAHPDCGVVFQDYSLFPWLNARANIMLALKQRNKELDKKELAHIADEYLSLVNLGHAVKKYPGQMSGGMRQRAAIARALAYGSELLLMDEPFGALDPVTRVQLQDLLLQISREQQRTVVFVTHDVDEAILLANRIVMFAPGREGAVTKVIEVPFRQQGIDRQQLFASAAFKDFREFLLTEMNEQLLTNFGDEQIDGAGI